MSIYVTDSDGQAQPVAEGDSGAVGHGDYEVQEGDCMDSIAYYRGFFWETLWNLGENSELKEKRKDPNVLLPGDHVTIPPLREKEESRASDAQHKFRRKGVPAKLRLRLTESEEKQKEPKSQAASDASVYEDVQYDPPDHKTKARANVPYILDIDGHLYTSNTDGDGRIEQSIPPNARDGRLVLNPGTADEEVYPLQLGGVDPKTEPSGVRQRLSNLGFLSPDGDDSDDALRSAIASFQEANGLDVTGKANQATIDKLYDVHGS